MKCPGAKDWQLLIAFLGALACIFTLELLLATVALHFQAFPCSHRPFRYNSLREEHEVTPEEMEAYRLKKSRGDDPLEFMKTAKEAAAAAAGAGGTGGYDFV